ncbi:DUF3348 family protein [Spongiibacter sp.]|uniref:DUF3348 family protein n=1 Tax=Spongiibacter sp. TaxID=2024860 RepID=UPI0035688264
MPKAVEHAPINSSRLGRFLAELGLATTAMPARDFADKLGQLIDLSGSITLSEALRGLRRVTAQPADSAGIEPRQRFMACRAEIINAVCSSFTLDADAVTQGRASFILPAPNADTFGEDAAGYQPYQRFYALHQSEMDHRILALRAELRKVLSRRSDTLAKLAALDATLADSLADYSRRGLAVIPKLLAQHFFGLREAHRQHLAESADSDGAEQWLQAGGWLAQFHQDMQSLLLAELALRLQPAQGLLEALEAEQGAHTTVAAHNEDIA